MNLNFKIKWWLFNSYSFIFQTIPDSFIKNVELDENKRVESIRVSIQSWATCHEICLKLSVGMIEFYFYDVSGKYKAQSSLINLWMREIAI